MPGESGFEGERATLDTAAAIDAATFDFVALYLEDDAAGRTRPLADYLARFPGAEDAIALEYLRLRGEVTDSVAGRGRAGGAGISRTANDDGARRIAHYRLARELGRGGQGAVWLAVDEQLGRRVALKLLASPFVTDERRARFRREAESIARLDHPGLAGVHDADLDGEVPWIAMRHVEGVDLKSSLESAKALQRDEAPEAAGGGPVLPWMPRRRADVMRVLLYFERAARALHAAHEEGVVHRDVKPGNLMVTPEGEPVILDFGLARGVAPDGDGEAARATSQREAVLTRDGEMFGTPAYMAPEQFLGRPDELDRRADVWSLGVTIVEALTGERPFEGASPHLLARAILEAPVPDLHAANPALSSDVQVVLETALERDRDRRYPTARELAEDLRRIREFEPVRARRASPLLRLRRWCRREPAWAATIGVTVAALVVGLVLSARANDRMRGLLEDKQVALDLATARRYVGQVPEFLARSPAGALALGLEAVGLHDAWWTRSALFGPLEQLTLERRLAMPEGRVWQAALIEGGARVVGCSTGGHVCVFDVRSGELVASVRLHAREAGGERAPGARRLAVVGDGRAVIVGCGDGSLHRLSLPRLAPEWTQSVGTSILWLERCAALGAERGDDGARGEEVAVLAAGAGLALLRASDGEVRLAIEVPEGTAGEVRVVGVGDGPRALLTAPRARSGARAVDSVLRLWSLEDGRPLAAHDAGVPIERIAVRGRDVLAGTAAGDVLALRLAAVDPTVSTRSARSVESAESAESTESVKSRESRESRGLAELTAPTAPALGLALERASRVAHSVAELAFDDARDGVLAGTAGGAESILAWEPRRSAAGARVHELDADVIGLLARASDVVVACADNTLRVLAPAGAAAGDVLQLHREEDRVDHLLSGAGPEGSDASRLLAFGVSRYISVWRERPVAASLRRAVRIAGRECGTPVAVVRTRGAIDAVVATSSGDVLLQRRPSDVETAPAPDWVLLASHGEGRVALAASDGGERFASAGADGVVRLCDDAGAELARASLEAEPDGFALLAIASDGSAAAAVAEDGRVVVLRDDRTAARSDAIGDVTAVAVGRRGEVVALGRADGSVTLLRCSTSGVTSTRTVSLAHNMGRGMREDVPAVRDLDFAADERSLVVASHEIWLDEIDVASGERRGTGERGMRTRWVRALSGARVLACGEEVLTCRITPCSSLQGALEPAAGEAVVRPAKQHDGRYTCLDVSADGRLVASGSEDGTVLVWEAATGATLARYSEHDGPVRSVDVGADGRVASVAADGTLAIWPVDPTPLARRLAPRGLDPIERSRLEALTEPR